MTIKRLTAFGAEEIADMDRLMHELSPTSDCTEERLRRVVEDEYSRVMVAVEDGRIVGTATLCIAHTPEFTIGFVEAVVVLKEHRGKHIATSLMEVLLTEAREAGVQQLHLTSNPLRVAANRMYQKMGFRRKRTNCYEMNL